MGIFEKLNSVNVNGHTEKKNGLTYLSWAWAWAEVKKAAPDATYTIYENKDGWNYFTDGRTCWVKTGVTIDGIEHIEMLPVMDHRNRSIPLDQVTSFDVNKSIQRSLTKACARHGLGLYIYAGEDLPEGEDAPEPVIISREKPDVVPVSSQTYTELVTITTPEEREALEGRYGKLLNLDEQSILTLIKKIKAKKAADIKEETK